MTKTGFTILITIITFTVTLVLTVPITAIITFIFVNKAPEKVNDAKNPDDRSPQEEAFYDQLMPSSSTITEYDHVVIQPNPAYSASHKEILDTHSNSDYENCD